MLSFGMCVGAYRSFVCLVCVVFVPIVLHPR